MWKIVLEAMFCTVTNQNQHIQNSDQYLTDQRRYKTSTSKLSTSDQFDYIKKIKACSLKWIDFFDHGQIKVKYIQN